MSWVWQAVGGGNGGGGPPAPPPGWSDVYSVNMLTQPTQAIGAAGAYTIDGRTWYAKNAPGIITSSLTNGTGLRLSMSTSANMGTSGAYATRFFAIPLTQIPEVLFTKPFAVRARFSLSSPSQITAYCGFVDCTNDGAGLLAAQRSRDAICGNEQTGGLSSGFRQKMGVNGEAPIGGAPASVLVGQNGYGVMCLGLNPTQKQMVAFAGSPAGLPAPPAVPTMLEVNAGTSASPSLNLPLLMAYTNIMVGFFVSSASGVAVYADLTALAVSQPK